MGGIDYLRLDKTKDKSYRFDHALDETSSQEDVYRCTTEPLVRGCLLGYNSTCFAYGATGSGKTFTMTGSHEMPGVIPLTIDALFAACAAAQEEYSTTLWMQYVEIYNEQIKDLLEPKGAQGLHSGLDVREDPKKGTFVAGATNRVVASRAELEKLLHTANLYRTTDSTNCNEVSSRSHAVLQLRLETTQRFGATVETRVGKLSMIDLAGSERAQKTNNAGKKLVEGANINRSLLALANCINALADKSKRGGHIPYRDSKLTRLLKDSLGGACKTVMITNVSPASDQFDETLNSLKYANRAKDIKTQQSTAQVGHPSTAVEMLSEVRLLRKEITREREAGQKQQRGRPPAKKGHGGGGGGGRRFSAPGHAGLGGAHGSRPATARPAATASSMSFGSGDATPLEMPLTPTGHGSGSFEPGEVAGEQWQQMAQQMYLLQAHELLDSLERDAVSELQLELAGLVAERMQLQESRAGGSASRWAALLRSLKGGETTAGAADEKLAAAARAEDAGAQAARQLLWRNSHELVAVHDALAGGVPSEERNEVVGLHWENALLRSELHATRQSLEQIRLQVEEIGVVSQTKAWRHELTAPLLTELSVTLATLSAEHEASLGLVSTAPARTAAPGTAPPAATPPPAARRPHFLAQLVPAMLQQGAERFGRLLPELRETMGSHRKARERICTELRLIQQGGPNADGAFSATRPGGTAAAAAKQQGGTGAAKLVRKLSRRLSRIRTPRRGAAAGAASRDQVKI